MLLVKITFNSPVILTYSIICALVYLLTGPMGVMKDLFVLIPEWNFSSASWYVRLFSHTMGHANTEHLMGNLAFILLIGPIVEEKYGRDALYKKGLRIFSSLDLHFQETAQEAVDAGLKEIEKRQK